jgi:hypothetical protein
MYFQYSVYLLSTKSSSFITIFFCLLLTWESHVLSFFSTFITTRTSLGHEVRTAGVNSEKINFVEMSYHWYCLLLRHRTAMFCCVEDIMCSRHIVKQLPHASYQLHTNGKNSWLVYLCVGTWSTCYYHNQPSPSCGAVLTVCCFLTERLGFTVWGTVSSWINPLSDKLSHSLTNKRRHDKVFK